MHLGLGGGEVSDLLTAEDSSEMADEGEDGRLAFPRAAEGKRAPVFIEHGESGQSGGERAGHEAILRASSWPRPTSTMGGAMTDDTLKGLRARA
jgi:hypothetical protein